MIVNKEVMSDSMFQVNLAEEEVGKSSTYGELRGIEVGFISRYISGLRRLCAGLEQRLRFLPPAGGARAEADGQGQGGGGAGHPGGAGLASEHGGQGDQGL